MAEHQRLQQELRPATQADLRQRATLLARIQTAKLLQMSESQMAQLIRDVESDPLFQKLLHPAKPGMKVLKFQPHPRTRLSPNFYHWFRNCMSFFA